MTTQPISRRRFLARPLRSPREPAVPSIDAHCLSSRGICCRSCADACPEAALRVVPALRGAARIVVEASRCTRCGDCARVCPADAIGL